MVDSKEDYKFDLGSQRANKALTAISDHYNYRILIHTYY